MILATTIINVNSTVARRNTYSTTKDELKGKPAKHPKAWKPARYTKSKVCHTIRPIYLFSHFSINPYERGHSMFRELLSSRWSQGGLAFFVLCVCGSLLYSWHVKRTTAAEMARHDRFTQGLHNQTETRPAETVNVPTENETPGLVKTPDETTDTPMPDATEALENETGNLDLADAFLPEDLVSEEEAPDDVPVSPFGYGPYPEVPNGYPEHLPPVWTWREEKRQFYDSSRLEDFELMARVLIKLWNQGDRNFTSVIRDDSNGKVYPLYKDVIYVTWADLRDENGNIIGKYPRNQLSSNQTQRVSFIDFMEGRIPPNIRFTDRETNGINPYDFLDLPRR